MTPQEVHERLKGDLFYYAEKAPLMLLDKEGKKVPFIPNRAQRFIHKEIEDQLKRKGFVRKLILKGRQQGASQYVTTRFYHKTSWSPGKNCFIMAHMAQATSTLFKKVKRYHGAVDERIRPSTKASNAKELVFDKLDSSYSLGTAGSGDVGRSETNQFFHGSEVAFWQNTNEIMTGVMQTIPRSKGTEVILESTANGIGNYFHKACVDALKGKGDFELIFVPWWWQEEYSADYDDDFEMDEEEFIYYRDNIRPDCETDEQAKRHVYWMRLKRIELKSLWKFKQEYPANAIEAFQTSGESLIKAEHIVAARKCTRKDPKAPLIMGVDSSGDGGDAKVVVFRRGREIPKYYKYKDVGQMEFVGILNTLIEKHKPVIGFFDYAYGLDTVDRLVELGHDHMKVVHFNNKADDPTMYRNKRAEMWCRIAEWLAEGDKNIPDDDELHADLACVPELKFTSDGPKRLESKEKIKQELGRSPDIGDGVALTFAYFVGPTAGREPPRKVGGGLTTKRNRVHNEPRTVGATWD